VHLSIGIPASTGIKEGGLLRIHYEARGGMASSMQGLALYRRILKAHRSLLPPDLRRLGDAYARDEFAKHRTADKSFQDVFRAEWEQYVTTLETQRQREGAVRGKDLEEERVAHLSDNQLKQLALLRRESTRPLKGHERAQHEHPHMHGPDCKH
jgi:hypothetical protein